MLQTQGEDHVKDAQAPNPLPPPWRVGWSPDGRRFYFHSPDVKVCYSGPRGAVVKTLWRVLPRYLDTAQETQAPPEVVAAIEAEISRIQPQKGVGIETKHQNPLKCIAGTVLTFRGYSPGEAGEVRFRRGDRLLVDERGTGDGISVTRIWDGAQDCVWPEEVTIARNQNPEVL